METTKKHYSKHGKCQLWKQPTSTIVRTAKSWVQTLGTQKQDMIRNTGQIHIKPYNQRKRSSQDTKQITNRSNNCGSSHYYAVIYQDKQL